MESEEFYDSLEEDSENDKVADFLAKERSCRENLLSSELSPEDIVPFYDKSLSRAELELCKNISKCSAILGGRRHTGKSKKSNVKSYLNIFYKKAGGENRRKSLENTSTSNLSPKSYVTCENSEANSFYLKSEDSSESSCENLSTLKDVPKLSLGDANAENDLLDGEGEFGKIKSGKPRRKCRSPQTITTKLPELGRLGPEIRTDKLELLRRRQQYGKTVSQTNRMKMLEKKALQDLQREINNSRVYL